MMQTATMRTPTAAPSRARPCAWSRRILSRAVERAVEPAKKPSAVRSCLREQDRAERRGEGQRDDTRQDDRDDDRHRELLVQGPVMPPMNATGMKTEQRTMTIAISACGAGGWRDRRDACGDVARPP